MRNNVKWIGLMVFLAALTLPLTAFAGDAGKGANEGIKVHGHWRIEVRNPDGTLDKAVEFDNAYQVSSGGLLPRVLTHGVGGFGTVGPWEIVINNVCEDPASPGTPANCLITESGYYDPPVAANVFETLAVTNISTEDPLPDTSVMEMRGTTVAQLDGQITFVSTVNAPCLSSVAPDTCMGPSHGPRGVVSFTHAFLGTPVGVQTGQQVLVIVTVTFT